MNDLVALSILLDGPKHGYAIKKQAGRMTGRADMHNNLIYPLLRGFVEKGWVTQRESAGERGQRRQVYAITVSGRRALAESLCSFGPIQARSAEAFRLRVGFFGILAFPRRAEILAKRKAYLESQDGKLARIKGAVEVGRWGGEVIRFVRQQGRRELAWIARLEKLAGRAGLRKRKER
jgi:DNA-binding PadR family transcriptional regulator